MSWSVPWSKQTWNRAWLADLQLSGCTGVAAFHPFLCTGSYMAGNTRHVTYSLFPRAQLLRNMCRELHILYETMTKLHIQFMDEWWWNFALLLTYIKWIVLVDLYSKTVILVCLNTQNQCEIDDFGWKSCMCFFLMATLTITLTISLYSYNLW